jgi:type II secretory ATPase GspE/PulE/Tfp pilus assembly ATPase PilB-like protein
MPQPVQEPTITSPLSRLASLNVASHTYVIEVVDLILDEAVNVSASDVHLLPTSSSLEVYYRIDGVLQLAGVLPKTVLPNVVARLKLLANMITYRTDIPQEGRILEPGAEVEKRVSSFPTHHGEKVVIRLFGGVTQFQRLPDLGLPEEILDTLSRLLSETSGAILFAGPAGSGKTTTLYTCFREISIASRGGRSLMTLEDPIEMLVAGVAQAQINQAAGLDLAVGLRSMMRQDPEVIGVGEIRDLATAEVAFQASLTGHLLLCTFHAGSATGVIGRLTEMGIEPYVIISGVRAIVCQRLVRRLCTCARPAENAAELLGLDVTNAWVRVGCPRCRGTGYRGRVMLAEIFVPSDRRIRRAIRAHVDVLRLEELARRSGMIKLSDRARDAVQAGLTDPVEVRRVLGISNAPSPTSV